MVQAGEKKIVKIKLKKIRRKSAIKNMKYEATAIGAPTAVK